MPALMRNAGVPVRNEGCVRNLYIAHSTRVAAVCYLVPPPPPPPPWGPPRQIKSAGPPGPGFGQ